MPYFKVGKENSGNIELYYEDHGSGKPIVLIHGWPLSGRSWEKQTSFLLNAGYRVILYDRRGFGDSSYPTTGYDYDTFAHDLHRLITKLDLHEATLVGFSMGTGEVARYLGSYGSKQVEKAVFISSIPPFLSKANDNPNGMDPSVFDEIMNAISEDRLAYLTKFLSNFYNFDLLKGNRVSAEVVQESWNIAADASPKGTRDCVATWGTDFRKDLSRIDIPTLIIHGTADRILPFALTGPRLHEALPNSRFLAVDDGPHGLIWTHAEVVNRELLDFLKEEKMKKAA